MAFSVSESILGAAKIPFAAPFLDRPWNIKRDIENALIFGKYGKALNKNGKAIASK